MAMAAAGLAALLRLTSLIDAVDGSPPLREPNPCQRRVVHTWREAVSVGWDGATPTREISVANDARYPRLPAAIALAAELLARYRCQTNLAPDPALFGCSLVLFATEIPSGRLQASARSSDMTSPKQQWLRLSPRTLGGDQSKICLRKFLIERRLPSRL